MGSSWSGFQPQNEIVKLNWAVLEASGLDLTVQEFARLLGVSELNEPVESDELLGNEEPDVAPES